MNKYNDEKAKYDSCLNKFNEMSKKLRESNYRLFNEYDKKYNELLKYKSGMINSLLNDTFEYSHKLSFECSLRCNSLEYHKTHIIKYEALHIKYVLDKLELEYRSVKDKINNLRKDIVPIEPKFPVSTHVIVHNNINYNYSLKQDTLKKVNAAIERKHKRESLVARAAAYNGTQRQLANNIRRQLSHQVKIDPHCPYCGTLLDMNNAHADHIYPISKGGLSTSRNMVYVCTGCNLAKSNLTLRNFIRRMKHDPKVVYARLELLHKDF